MKVIAETITVDARDLQRGDLVVERDDVTMAEPYLILGAERCSGVDYMTCSILIPSLAGTRHGVLTGACCKGSEQHVVIRPPFDPVIEHARATFAEYIARHGIAA